MDQDWQVVLDDIYAASNLFLLTGLELKSVLILNVAILSEWRGAQWHS